MGTAAKTLVECKNKPYPVTINTKALVYTGEIVPAAYSKSSDWKLTGLRRVNTSQYCPK
jgi:hypothetical protein